MNHLTYIELNITKNAKSALQEIRAVHDWVAWNVKYDFGHDTPESTIAQQASETLVNHTGVCLHEACLASALLRSIGIPCENIAGATNTGSAHEWNRAWDGKEWIVFDINEDQIYLRDAQWSGLKHPVNVTHDNFNPTGSDLTLFNKTHTPDTEQFHN